MRNAVLVILGLMIGATLSPSILDQMVRWPVSLAGVVVYVAVVTGIQYLFFRHIGGYDRPTAYFSAAPGGFMAMTVIGGEYGGSERVIALMHSIRVVLVVFVLVLSFEHLIGADTKGSASHYLSLVDVTAANWAVLFIAGALGLLLSRILRLPGAAIIGPMIVMGLIEASGLSEVNVPSGPILVAEVILGSSIGAQFAGTTFVELRRGAGLATVSTLAMLAISVLFALVLHALTGLDLLALILAFSPGGMSGISLIALALSIEPAFVTIHNMLRMLIILLTAPILFRVWKGKAGRFRH